MSSLLEALAGYSNWPGYGHGERASAWLVRREVNRLELEAFRALPSLDVQPYAARAQAIAPARGLEAPAHVRSDARGAIDRATHAADLNAFTWIPNRPLGGGDGFCGEDWHVLAVSQRLQALAPAPNTPFAR